VKLALLGSTGSIGTQALDVLDTLELDVTVTALAAGRNIDLLSKQIQRFQPALASVQGPAEASQLAGKIGSCSTEILHGADGLRACVIKSDSTRINNALVGAAGLKPTLDALNAGIDVALANKESLVIGGELVRQAQQNTNAKLFPIDSEHSALWQLAESCHADDIERLIITASGGSLRDWPLDQFEHAKPEDVLAHPNWEMGARITVDSATLVNKAFEVIEAHWLFDLPMNRIDAVLHPQSLVHGMVELRDGATLAHIGMPDMKVPIQYALTAPHHQPINTPRMDWTNTRLDFGLIDPNRYPAFFTLLAGHEQGGTTLAALNAADEVLIQRFLNDEIPFTSIAAGLSLILDEHNAEPLSLKTLQHADQWARERMQRL
jgi:1-deoxy-D-xylulose-5-phosphate reductoisomerase